MKVLLTGATGYLGSRLAKALVREGHRVAILKRSSSDTRLVTELLPELAAYDLDRSPLSRPFEDLGGVDAVIHAATCYGRGGESALEIFQANLSFPLTLLETARRFQTGLFLNTDTSLDPGINAYALSKKQFAAWGRLLAEQGGTRFVNVELEHFYGPGDQESKFVTHVMKSCLRNVPELKLTRGEQARDFIFIGDVVAAYLMLLEKGQEGPSFSDYPLGSGKEITIRELVETIWRLAGSRTILNFGALPYRANEAMHCRADTSLLEALGWRAKTALAQGLEQTVEYERKEETAS